MHLPRSAQSTEAVFLVRRNSLLVQCVCVCVPHSVGKGLQESLFVCEAACCNVLQCRIQWLVCCCWCVAACHVHRT